MLFSLYFVVSLSHTFLFYTPLLRSVSFQAGQEPESPQRFVKFNRVRSSNKALVKIDKKIRKSSKQMLFVLQETEEDEAEESIKEVKHTIISAQKNLSNCCYVVYE